MFYYFIGPLLDINDLQYVLDTLNEAGFSQRKWKHLASYLGLNWKPLGLSLGLYSSTLVTINAEYPGDDQECLRQCLVKWLERADRVDNEGGPRMSSLFAALEDIGEKATADYISKLLLLLLLYIIIIIIIIILIHCIYYYVVLHDTSFNNIIYVLSYMKFFLYLFLGKNIINKDSPGIIIIIITQ